MSAFLDPPEPEPRNPDDERGEDEWIAEHRCPDCGDTIRCDNENCGCRTMAECRCSEIQLLRDMLRDAEAECRRVYDMLHEARVEINRLNAEIRSTEDIAVAAERYRRAVLAPDSMNAGAEQEYAGEWLDGVIRAAQNVEKQ